jgi:hypothetical protein
MKERFRRFESNVEKAGGVVIGLVSLISLNAPGVAVGVALYFVGIAREPNGKPAPKGA